MYEREQNGYTISWDPEDEEAAEQAMMKVVDRFDEWKGSMYTVYAETAAEVRDRYKEIVNA